MTNHDEGAPGRGVSGKSKGARAGDSMCGEINRTALVRLSGPGSLPSHPLSPHTLTSLTPGSHPLSPLSPHVLSTVTPQGCVTAEVTYGAACMSRGTRLVTGYLMQ